MLKAALRELTFKPRDHNARGCAARCRYVELRRNPGGFFLVETIIALAVTGILAAAMIGVMAESLALTSSTQNKVFAMSMAQEVIDNARNTPYASLVDGTYDLLVNKTESDQAGPSVVPRSLLLDTTSQTWTPQAQHNLFQGTAQETIANGTYANTKEVTVTITWKEGDATKVYSISTLISQAGIHN